MHMKAKRPVFVPREHWAELEKLSKAALMDMVWDYAMQIGGTGQTDAEVQSATLEEFRYRRAIILTHRSGIT